MLHGQKGSPSWDVKVLRHMRFHTRHACRDQLQRDSATEQTSIWTGVNLGNAPNQEVAVRPKYAGRPSVEHCFRTYTGGLQLHA